MISKVRHISDSELGDIAFGATVLGAGGGGDPYIGRLMASEAIRARGDVELVPAEEVDDDALVVQAAMMGAPTVMVEKLPNGREIVGAFLGLEEHVGKPIQYVTALEAGGLNSMIPLIVGASLRRPVVDADGMGRAFPELQMVTPTLFGISSTPMTIADEKGNLAAINSVNNIWAERIARAITAEMGSTALIAMNPLTGRQLKDAMVLGTISRAEQIGQAVRVARREHRDPLRALLDATRGRLIFRGNVSDVSRRTQGGFVRGEAIVRGADGYDARVMTIRFQNENLVALEREEVVVSVPDLITIVDAETAEPITTEALRYGFRVNVLGIPCDPKWRTPAGLEVVGPARFGYDVAYVPVEDRFAT